MADRWGALGNAEWSALSRTRVTVHWAVQLIAAVGGRLIPPEDDDSHRSMRWRTDLRRFEGRPTRDGTLIAVDPRGLGVEIEAPDGAGRAELALNGTRLDDALRAVANAMSEISGERLRLERPGYDLPDHPVAHGRSGDRALDRRRDVAWRSHHRWTVRVRHSLAVPSDR